MDSDNNTSLATLIVVATGVLWGFYWLPVRQLATIALPGAWGTVAIVAAATVMLAPFAVKGRQRLANANRLTLASIALGGVAFVLYSVGFVYGRVAIIILLFFLTPVWSTLIARYIMGWPTPPLRIAAIVVGLTGLAIMLGADGAVPIPRGTGEWLALLSGILWSFATTGIRAKADLQPGEASFVFAAGALAGAIVLAPALEPLPGTISLEAIWPALGWVLAAGGLWWGASMAGLMWAASRLDPARVGILLMSEVLIGTVSAAVLVGEHVGLFEIIGGGLVLAAGVFEVWPIRRYTSRKSK